MQETILKYAKDIGTAGEGQEALLEALCLAAEAELTGRLREGLTPEDCGEAFPVAAAWLALAGLCVGQAGEPSAWSAGAVSVSGAAPAEKRADNLRRQAEELMAPYLRDEGFWFQGVRG